MLLLLPTTTYRTKAFVDAALKLDVDVVAASEQPSTLASKNPEGLLELDFSEPERAARQAGEFAAEFPIDAVIPVDEDTAVVAASVAHGLSFGTTPFQPRSPLRTSIACAKRSAAAACKCLAIGISLWTRTRVKSPLASPIRASSSRCSCRQVEA